MKINTSHPCVFRLSFLAFALIAALAGAGDAFAAGTYGGSVFADYNMNGRRNLTGAAPNYAIDNGIAGVTVTIFAANGASKSTVSASDGSWTIDSSAAPALPAGPYRVEYTNLPVASHPTAVGGDTGTTVRFVADGGAAALNLGVTAPREFCPNTSFVVTNSYVVGTGSFATLVRFPYRFSDELDGNILGTWSAAPSRDAQLQPTLLADADAVGSTFSLSWDNLADRVYAGAYLKRGARFGSLANESTGAIYTVSGALSAAPAASVFVDLNAVFGAGTAGSNPHPVATTIDWTDDTASISQIGKVGLGGLKLSSNGSTLYAVNLADKRLYVIPTSGALNSSTITRFNIPTSGLPAGAGTCAPADVRPFALGRSRSGQIFVGAVCSAESESDDSKVHAYIWRFDNPGFTLVTNNTLTFTRTVSGTESGTWLRWANVTGVINRPSPMLTDIEFDGNDMVLGFRDRYGDQVVLPDFYRGYGDVVRACPNGGGFSFESNGTCGSLTTTGGAANTGNGGRELYNDLNGDGREEGALGGLAQVPGFNHVISTFYDPVTYNSAGTRVNNYYTAGIQRYSNSTGQMTGAYDVYIDSDPGNFGKADGIGDTEVLCEMPPLEIGNRVWYDTNPNGVQDPGESGAPNVSLELWADTDDDLTVDTQVGSVQTNANGEYTFGGVNNNGMTGACGATQTATVYVNNSSDDAEQNLSTNTVSTTNADLELTADGNTLQAVGIRFNNLDIPQGATISNAYIEFTPRSGQTVSTGNPAIRIYAQNTDHAPTFSATANDITNRPLTSSFVNWSPAAWTAGTPGQTANISSLVSEIVGRADWAKGNSMAFVMNNAAANNFRRAWSFDGSLNINAPRLVVEFQAPCRSALQPNTVYQIRVPTSNFQSGQPLEGRFPSTANFDPTPNGDSRDSDGVFSAGSVSTTLTTGNAGENNHTYDFGFMFTPTAASGAINGAVRMNGRGVPMVRVTLTGGPLTQPLVTYTSSFGYYSFDELPVGEYYVVSVESKKHNFYNPSMVVNLQDNVADADFEAMPINRNAPTRSGK